MKRPFLLFFVSSLAAADIGNRNFLPFGEVESFIGNCGTAGAESATAVYYNPAALTTLSHPRISVTASSYFQYSVSADSLGTVGGVNLPFRASTFQTVPGALISTFGGEEYSWAYFLLVPESMQIEHRFSWILPNGKVTFLQNQSSTDIWGGFSVARKIDPQWSVGLTVFGINHRTSASTTIISTSSDKANTAGSTSLTMTTNVYAASATLGVLYRATDGIDAGLRLQTPLVRLAGKGSGFASKQSTDNGTVAESTIQEDDLRTQYQLPWDATLGLRLNFADVWNFWTEASLQSGLSYDTIEDSTDFSTRESVSVSTRYNLGLSYGWSENTDLYLGFSVVPSAERNADAAGSGAITPKTITGGVSWKTERVKTGVGLFFTWANNVALPVGTATSGGLVQTRIYGALLSVGYLL